MRFVLLRPMEDDAAALAPNAIPNTRPSEASWIIVTIYIDIQCVYDTILYYTTLYYAIRYYSILCYTIIVYN